MSLSCFSSLLATLAKHIFEQPGQYRAWMLPSCPNCCYGAERGLNCDWSTQQDHIFAALWFNLQAAPELAEPPDQQQVQPEGPLLQLNSSPPSPPQSRPQTLVVSCPETERSTPGVNPSSPRHTGLFRWHPEVKRSRYRSQIEKPDTFLHTFCSFLSMSVVRDKYGENNVPL